MSSKGRKTQGELVLTCGVGQSVVLSHKDAAQEVEVDCIIEGKVRLRFIPIDGACRMRVWRSKVWDEREERGEND